MRKQRKLLTTEEKEKICKDRGGICVKRSRKSDFCPLCFMICNTHFCYKEHINALEEILKKTHNEEIEY